jgi:hypothetical protein
MRLSIEGVLSSPSSSEPLNVRIVLTAPRYSQGAAKTVFLPRCTPFLWRMQMFNWPEMLRHAEDWANGFFAGAATVSLIGIAGAAFVLLVRTI